MKKSLAIALFLSVSVNAYAVDSGAVVGGAVGGAAGAAVGYNMGGQNGAILGAAIGGATGAAVGSRDSAPAAQPVLVQTVSSRNMENDDGRQRHDKGFILGNRRISTRKSTGIIAKIN